MRGAMWGLAAAAGALWLAAAAYPAVMAIAALARLTLSGVDHRGMLPLLLSTTGWAGVIGLAAVAIGWAPGRALGAALHRRRYAVLATACLLPICLPAYLVFYAWWQSWPSDSTLYRWAVQHELIGALRVTTLGLSLACWSWPIVAWSVAGLAAGDARRRREVLLLDGAGPGRRAASAARHDAPGLLLGAAIVFLLVFQNTTCFDLAQVYTFGNELRAVAQLGANARDLLTIAAPALLLALLGATALWTMLARRRAFRGPVVDTAGRASLLVAGVVWLTTVGLPLTLLLSRISGLEQIGSFLALYREGLANALTLAGAAGACAALLAVALAGQWSDRRRGLRAIAHGQAAGWLIAAVVPVTIAAVALESAYNIPVIVPGTGQNVREALAAGGVQSHSTVADLMYRSPAILLLGHLSRFGAVGALLGWWLARQEPRPRGELRRLDGAEHLRGWTTAMGPAVVAAASAAFAVTLVLSLGEVGLTAQIQPPGVPLIASTILNDMHYQRPATVMVAAAIFVALALLAALVVAFAQRALRPVPAVLLLVVVLAGCGRTEPGTVTPLDTDLTFGAPGLAPGQFNYPRGIAVDRERGWLFIVDKTARVQRFGLDGEPQCHWRMPERELGKPTGLNVAPDGTVWVADTHYFRVIRYDADGRELQRFGRYGQGPGEFIYPTDVAFRPDGTVYVSEYGGNDRVQVFSPGGDYLFAFGAFGAGRGELNRPQSMVFSPDGSELFIADACNHRIVVVDPEGVVLRELGGPGHGPGELMYPYDIAFLADGTLLVCEFGNNRVQRLAPDQGQCRGLLGGEGPLVGHLRYPWGVDVAGRQVFILDSGNNRVQVIEL